MGRDDGGAHLFRRGGRRANAAVADSGNFRSHHTGLPSAHLRFHLFLPGRSHVFLAVVFLIDPTHRRAAAVAAGEKFIGVALS